MSTENSCSVSGSVRVEETETRLSRPSNAWKETAMLKIRNHTSSQHTFKLKQCWWLIKIIVAVLLLLQVLAMQTH